MKIIFIILALSLCFNCYAGDDTLYADGVYEGSHSFVSVKVKIENNKISNIDITRHGGGGQKYADMISPMAKDVIRHQSLNIDTITGATVSSENFINAVNDALEKAKTIKND
jgi:urocanate reductase